MVSKKEFFYKGYTNYNFGRCLKIKVHITQLHDYKTTVAKYRNLCECMYSEYCFTVLWISFHNPVTTQCRLYVCGEMSWWKGQALMLGQSYTKFPQMNTDAAQQLSTSWGCGGMADIDRSGWVSSSGVWHGWKKMNRWSIVPGPQRYCNSCERQVQVWVY